MTNSTDPVRLVVTAAIHRTNHTQTSRVCNLNENNNITELVMNDSKTFTNLMPGIYSIDINGVSFFFDLYIAVVGTREKLVINNPYYAYAKIDNKIYPINLYTQESTNSSNEITLSNTVNDHIEMIIVNGKTIEVPYFTPEDISEKYAIIPKDQDNPSFDVEANKDKTLAELEIDHIIFYDLDYENHSVMFYTIGLDGKSEGDINTRYAVIPNNGIIPTSEIQASESKSITRLESEGNTILSDLDYKVSSYIETTSSEYETASSYHNDLSDPRIYEIGSQYAIIPKDQDNPSFDVEANKDKTLDELRNNNTILYGIDYDSLDFRDYGYDSEEEFKESGTDFIDLNEPPYNEFYNDDKRFMNRPFIIQSVSKFKINTVKKSLPANENNELEILLKNNIKSLPNGVKDTFILNSEQCQNHIIYRIGRLILNGTESWEFIEEYSTSKSWLFWMPYKYVKLENTYGNIICSHFNNIKSSDLIYNHKNVLGIASSYGDRGNGFFLRILPFFHTGLDNTVPLKKWLSSQARTGCPVVVEYALQDYIYNTVLIDEYHIKTYFSKTYITLDNNYDTSYFYKTLKQKE